jgi:hypothetical protein
MNKLLTNAAIEDHSSGFDRHLSQYALEASGDLPLLTLGRKASRDLPLGKMGVR